MGNIFYFHATHAFSRYPEDNTDWDVFFTFGKLAVETVI